MKKRSLRRYSALWCEGSGSTGKSLHTKDKIDILCKEADLCTSTEDYTLSLATGMTELLSDEKNRKFLKSHMELEDKLKQLGRDIVEKSRGCHKLKYIGVFAHLKINQNWLAKKVYELLVRLLAHYKQGVLDFSASLKNKLEKLSKELFDKTTEHRSWNKYRLSS